MYSNYLEKLKAYLNENDLESADLYFEEILKYAKSKDIDECIDICAKLIPIYQECIELWKEKWGGEDPDRFNNYSMLIDIFLTARAYEQVEDYFEKIVEEEIKDYIVPYSDVIDIYKYIPCLNYKLGYEKKEERSVIKLNDIIQRFVEYELCGDISYFGIVYFDMCKILSSLNEYNKSIEYFEKAIYYYKEYEKLHSPVSYEFNERLNRVYEQMYNYAIEIYEFLEDDKMVGFYREEKNKLNK